MQDEVELVAAAHVADGCVVGIDHAQDSSLHEDARESTHTSRQSIQSILRGGGSVAMWPAGSETSEDLEDERGRFSKIRARCYLRLDESNTAHAASSRGSRVREQQVVHRKPTRSKRPGPLSQLCL